MAIMYDCPTEYRRHIETFEFKVYARKKTVKYSLPAVDAKSLYKKRNDPTIGPGHYDEHNNLVNKMNSWTIGENRLRLETRKTIHTDPRNSSTGRC